jgi:hypothetical protein
MADTSYKDIAVRTLLNHSFNLPGFMWEHYPARYPQSTITNLVPTWNEKKPLEAISVWGAGSLSATAMATFSGREQTEWALFEKAGELWARVADMVYSPAASVSTPESGERSVRIGIPATASG